MKDFQHFYEALPGLFKLNDGMKAFQKYLSFASPSEGQFCMLFDESEMIQLVLHPQITWTDLPVFIIEHYAEHPLTHLLSKMIMDKPIPFEQDLANAFSQRFGAEGSISLLQHSHCFAGHHAGGYDSRNVTAARVALIMLLQPGGLDALVDLFMHQSKNTRGWSPSSHTTDSRRTGLYDALPDADGVMKFTVATAFSLATALMPESVKESVGRYFDGMSAWEALAGVSSMWGSQANMDNIRNGMLYVLNRVLDGEHLGEFIEHSLPKDAASRPSFEGVDKTTNATLIISALHSGQAASLIEAMHSGLTESQWQEVVRCLYLEEAPHWLFDVMALVHGLGDDSPLYREIAKQPSLNNLLDFYYDNYYVPSSLASIAKWLSHIAADEPAAREIFTRNLARTCSRGVRMDFKSAYVALEIFSEFDFYSEVVTQTIDTHKLVLSAFRAVRKDWDQRSQAMKVLGNMIARQIIEPEAIYSKIKDLEEFEEFSRHSSHDAEKMKPFLSSAVKKSLVSKSLSI